MFAFTRSDVQRIAVSAAGALLFSTVCIGGAVAPASAATPVQAAPATFDAWQRDTAQRIDSDLSPAQSMQAPAPRTAQLGIMVAADGRVFAPVLLQSSGSRRIDRQLLRRAAVLTLAPLPGDRATALPVVLRVSLRDARFATVAWPTATRLAAR